jgi:hypothetical protein
MPTIAKRGGVVLVRHLGAENTRNSSSRKGAARRVKGGRETVFADSPKLLASAVPGF